VAAGPFREDLGQPIEQDDEQDAPERPAEWNENSNEQRLTLRVWAATFVRHPPPDGQPDRGFTDRAYLRTVQYIQTRHLPRVRPA